MPDITFSSNFHPGFIALSDEFILQHMPVANGTYVKVFLYAYHHYCNGTSGFSTRSIAEALGLIESDVLESLNYWQSKRLLQIEQGDTGMRISFNAGGTAPQPPKCKTRRQDPAPKAEPAASKVVRVEHKPTYAPEELAIYQSNPQIQQLFNKAASSLGESLSFPNLSLLYSFYDYYRLPVDVIEYLIDYCISIGGRTLRYMERVAQDWSDQGIHSVTEAKEYVTRYTIYRPIMKALHMKGARPAAADLVFMDRWISEYQMPMELIIEACNRTFQRTGQASFNYADSILEDWYNRNIKTMEGVARADEAFSKSRIPSVQVSGNPKGSFHTYMTHDDWDFDAIERLAQQELYSAERK